MKFVKPILLILFFLALSVLSAFYFAPILKFMVGKIGFGWVLSTILIRLLVIVLFSLALKSVFMLFKRTQKVKSWITLLIAAGPGFLISFLFFPIYNTDYGMLDDKVKLESIENLQIATDNSFEFNETYNILAFVTVDCHFCMAAAKHLALNREAGQTVKTDFFFSNNKEDVNTFVSNNGIEAFPYHIIPDDSTFFSHSGYSFPSIFVINPNGETIYHWVGEEMNFTALDYLRRLE